MEHNLFLYIPWVRSPSVVKSLLVKHARIISNNGCINSLKIQEENLYLTNCINERKDRIFLIHNYIILTSIKSLRGCFLITISTKSNTLKKFKKKHYCGPIYLGKETWFGNNVFNIPYSFPEHRKE